jgi:hypothetical protein
MSTEEMTSTLTGIVVKKPASKTLRLLFILTGLIFFISLARIFFRFALGYKAIANLCLFEKTFLLKINTVILGKTIRKRELLFAFSTLQGIEIEEKWKYIHILIGAGFFSIGFLLGIHWLLDGLRANYPYLALVGIAVIFFGIFLDLLLYILIPNAPAGAYLKLSKGPWFFQIGANSEEIKTIFEQLHLRLK